MAPGEEVLDFDVGRVGDLRADIVASNKAIYIKMANTASRTRYEEFSDIIDGGRFSGISFKLLTGAEMRFFPSRAPRHTFKQVIADQLASRVKYDKTVEFPGGGTARWRWRPAADGSGYFWYIVTEGVAEPDEAFHRWMSETTSALSREFGVSQKEG